MSTIMPRRFISTNHFAAEIGESVVGGLSVEESAHSTFRLCVRVM